MKVISIGTDRNMFDNKSAVLERNVLYSSKISEMHQIVFTLKSENHKPYKINNLSIYPTNSVSEWFYVRDACRIGNTIFSKNNLVSKETVISTQDPFQTGLVGTYLAKKFQLPLQVQIHTDYLSSNFSKTFLNKIRIIMASYVIPKASEIRVVSETIKESLIKKFNKLENIDVLPVFVDIDKIINFVPGRDIRKDFPQFDSIVLVASRLSPEKKIDLAIKAFKDVVEKYSRVGLVIAGDGPEKQSLEDLVSSLGLKNNVVFIGWQDDLISLYKTADIFILTSEFEGYGMTLIEAGASGIPIVTTKVGMAKSEIFKDGQNCFVCAVGDKKCLADCMITLITEGELRELFKHGMQDSIKTTAISKEEYADKYVGLLKKLVTNI
ncbi:glycosyltransferase [Patescibacteria group bacterium]|nr:glycosyltransferase [Patescibacteria group bacterium]